ncbi:hypothetical protein ACVMGC_003001 [Bradyrhizobium barranii subsp. barranii]
MSDASDELDGSIGLRIGPLANGGYRSIEDLTALRDGCFTFPAELSNSAPALSISRRHSVRKPGLRGRDGRRNA